jgi:hypothetical protein
MSYAQARRSFDKYLKGIDLERPKQDAVRTWAELTRTCSVITSNTHAGRRSRPSDDLDIARSHLSNSNLHAALYVNQ